MLKSYLINVVAQGIGKVVSFGANFFVFIFIARLGGTELFGQYSFVLAFLAVAVAVADFGMSQVLGKDIAQLQEAAPVYWGNYLFLRLVISLVVAAVAIIVAYQMRNDFLFSLVIGAFALPFLASRFFEPVYQVYDHPWFSTYPSFAYGVAYIVLSLAVFLLKGSLFWLIVSYCTANIIYFAVAFTASCKLLKPVFSINREMLLKIIKIAAPLGVSSFFAIVGGRAAIFMLQSMKSDHDVAIFNAAYKFIELAAMAASMIVGPLIPIYSAKIIAEKENLRAEFSSTIEILAIMLIPCALICPFISHDLITLLYGQNFTASAPVLNVLAWVGVLIFYSLFFTSLAVSTGFVHFAYWDTAAGAIISIALNYLLIPHYSAFGSAVTALVCEIFLLSVTGYFVIKYFGNVIRWNRWAKVALANAVLGVLLYSLTGYFPLFLNILACLCLYGACVYILKAIPKEEITAFLINMKTAERFKSNL